MSDLFWLADAQMDRLRPFFPKSHGRPRVDDRRVVSGIVFMNRDGLRCQGIQPCIPGQRCCNEPVRYDKRRYRRRSRNKIMFGRFEDWRRVATRYDRCPTAFFSAIDLAATAIFWL